MTATSEQVWELLRELIESQKETERRFQETERRFQEIEQLLKEHTRKTELDIQELKDQISLGSKIGGEFGTFVEWSPIPVIIRLFRERGFDINLSSEDVTVKRLEGSLQIDLFLSSQTEAILVQFTFDLIKDDIDEHLERLNKFKQLMPRYRNYRTFGAIKAMTIPEDVASYAYCCGLFVLAQSGENIVILNDDKFQPRVW